MDKLFTRQFVDVLLAFVAFIAAIARFLTAQTPPD